MITFVTLMDGRKGARTRISPNRGIILTDYDELLTSVVDKWTRDSLGDGPVVSDYDFDTMRFWRVTLRGRGIDAGAGAANVANVVG